MASDWVMLARLVKARGIRGELAAELLTTGIERFGSVREAHLFAPGAEEPVRRVEIENAWQHGDRVILKFLGVDSMSDAEPLAGMELRVPLAERPAAPEGEYYQADLIGCRVLGRGGEDLGQVTGVENFGGPDLLVVLENGVEWMLPFVKAICVEVNIPERRIAVELPEGLRELAG